MRKVALLIGVSEYPTGLTPLPKAIDDAKALRAVLADPDRGEFDTVSVLENPNKQEVELELTELFHPECDKDDLVLLFFSGHGIKDDRGQLYLSTRITRKLSNGALNKATAVNAHFIHDLMVDCRSKRQVIILDCCYSGAFPQGLSLKDSGTLNLRSILGGEGRVILTSSSSTQCSLEQAALNHSVYTHYLLEGMKTVVPDPESDGRLSVDKLHRYAARQVREKYPQMPPEIHAIKDGYTILLVKPPKALSRQEIPENTNSTRQPSAAGELFDFETVTVDSHGDIIRRERKQARQVVENLGNGVTLEMVYIPGGTFLMGAPVGEAGSDDNEKPQHSVTLQPFYMSKYPVTQAQWQAIMDNNPSSFKGNNRPVENVSWEEAVKFCQQLSQRTGKSYQLPSEAQWEYACRAGTTTPFCYGETITTDLVNYNGNYPYGKGPKGQYRRETTPVGSFPPNAFGLYDLHGNVWEWCQDTWHDNYPGAPTEGSAWVTGGEQGRRLLRGGSWGSNSHGCRSACRSWLNLDYSYYYGGFRIGVLFA